MKRLQMMGIAIALFFTTLTAQAWREGNGGDGIRVNSKLFLLDLVEQGVESTPAATASVAVNPFFENEIKDWASKQPQRVPEKLILTKLSEIQRKNSLLAYLFVAGLKKLEWTWVNVPLRDIQDQGAHTVVDKSKLEQLALRINQSVHIQAGLWNELDERNQAALLFHEVLFSLVQPKRTPEGLSMSSPRVRRIIGFIFSQRLASESLDQVLKVEAPEFRFTSLSVKPLELFHFDASQSEMLFNAHWFVRSETPTGETTILNEVGLHDSELKTVRHICDFTEENHGQLFVGIAADQLTLNLNSVAPGVEEDYYLVHSFTQDTPVISMQIESAVTNANCVSQINELKTILIQDYSK